MQDKKINVGENFALLWIWFLSDPNITGELWSSASFLPNKRAPTWAITGKYLYLGMFLSQNSKYSSGTIFYMPRNFPQTNIYLGAEIN